MPFRPLRLCIVYDGARGLCDRVVPRMRVMLEHRAFLVDTHEVGQGGIDLDACQGLVLGSPATGLAIRGAGPSARLRTWVEAVPSLERVRVALFCVYDTRPGATLDRMETLVRSRGAEVVARQAYWALAPRRDDHVLPAECMVRIR
ncbi:MAG: hypothetical protein JXB39_12485 [Deltaproteobacteria bacterium]|nr:hypothetical protein [Deltaproteobacteria bacterium]